MSFRLFLANSLWSPRRHLLIGLCLGGVMVGTVLAQAPSRSVAPKPAGASASKNRAATPAKAATPAFTVEAIPRWVQPVAVDPALSAGLPKSALHVLVADRQVRIDGTSVSRFDHAVRQVNDSAGLESAAQLQIEFDPSYQTLALHQIEVWRNGGRIDKLDRGKVQVLHRETQLERQMIDGRLTASIVLDDVRVGDRVEFSYTLRGANPVFDGKFVDIDWTTSSRGPLALVQYRLVAPAERSIQFRAAPDSHVMTTEVRDGWRETVVRRYKVPQYQYDPNLPERAQIADQIQVSEFSNWEDVANWAAKVFAPAYETSSAALSAQIAALGGDPRDGAQAQIQRTLDFVQTDIRYFGTEIGPNTHRPALPDKVLQQRFGDCKDKVSLLIALLKAQGITATPLLVSGALRGDVGDMLPSPLAFNHVVAQVQLGDRTWILDGTRAMQKGPLAEREASILGRGLLARGGERQLVRLPDATAEKRVEVHDTLRFSMIAFDPVLESETTYFGDFAENVRATLASPAADEFWRQVASEYARLYQGAEPLGAGRVEELSGHNALRLSRRFKVPRYLRLNEQQQLVGDWGLATLAQPLRLPDQAPRRQPLKLGYPGIYRQTLEVMFPEPVYVRDASQSFDEVNPRFELHVQHETRSDSLRMTGEVRILSESLEPADWTGHWEKLGKVWSRLGGVIVVPAVQVAQTEALSARLQMTLDAVRKGQSSLKTADQVDAQLKLTMAQARLASGRLAGRNRVRVLVDQGIQMDHLSRNTEAQASFEEALKLDPDSSEAHAALSVNALLRQQDKKAIEHATRALALAPNDQGPRYTRAYALHYAGQLEQARDDLLLALKSRAEVDRSYAALWLYITTRKLGGDGVAAVREYVPRGGNPAWPYSVLRMFNGTGTLDQALETARADKAQADARLCELYFFLGQKQLVEGQIQDARASFQKALGTGVSEYMEYALAKRELASLNPAQ